MPGANPKEAFTISPHEAWLFEDDPDREYSCDFLGRLIKRHSVEIAAWACWACLPRQVLDFAIDGTSYLADVIRYMAAMPKPERDSMIRRLYGIGLSEPQIVRFTGSGRNIVHRARKK